MAAYGSTPLSKTHLQSTGHIMGRTITLHKIYAFIDAFFYAMRCLLIANELILTTKKTGGEAGREQRGIGSIIRHSNPQWGRKGAVLQAPGGGRGSLIAVASQRASHANANRVTLIE
jgi:hypothetical protein